MLGCNLDSCFILFDSVRLVSLVSLASQAGVGRGAAVKHGSSSVGVLLSPGANENGNTFHFFPSETWLIFLYISVCQILLRYFSSSVSL